MKHLIGEFIRQSFLKLNMNVLKQIQFLHKGSFGLVSKVLGGVIGIPKVLVGSAVVVSAFTGLKVCHNNYVNSNFSKQPALMCLSNNIKVSEEEHGRKKLGKQNLSKKSRDNDEKKNVSISKPKGSKLKNIRKMVDKNGLKKGSFKNLKFKLPKTLKNKLSNRHNLSDRKMDSFNGKNDKNILKNLSFLKDFKNRLPRSKDGLYDNVRYDFEKRGNSNVKKIKGKVEKSNTSKIKNKDYKKRINNLKNVLKRNVKDFASHIKRLQKNKSWDNLFKNEKRLKSKKKPKWLKDKKSYFMRKDHYDRGKYDKHNRFRKSKKHKNYDSVCESKKNCHDDGNGKKKKNNRRKNGLNFRKNLFKHKSPKSMLGKRLGKSVKAMTALERQNFKELNKFIKFVLLKNFFAEKMARKNPFKVKGCFYGSPNFFGVDCDPSKLKNDKKLKKTKNTKQFKQKSGFYDKLVKRKEEKSKNFISQSVEVDKKTKCSSGKDKKAAAIVKDDKEKAATLLDYLKMDPYYIADVKEAFKNGLDELTIKNYKYFLKKDEKDDQIKCFWHNLETAEENVAAIGCYNLSKIVEFDGWLWVKLNDAILGILLNDDGGMSKGRVLFDLGEVGLEFFDDKSLIKTKEEPAVELKTNNIDEIQNAKKPEDSGNSSGKVEMVSKLLEGEGENKENNIAINKAGDEQTKEESAGKMQQLEEKEAKKPENADNSSGKVEVVSKLLEGEGGNKENNIARNKAGDEQTKEESAEKMQQLEEKEAKKPENADNSSGKVEVVSKLLEGEGENKENNIARNKAGDEQTKEEFVNKREESLNGGEIELNQIIQWDRPIECLDRAYIAKEDEANINKYFSDVEKIEVDNTIDDEPFFDDSLKIFNNELQLMDCVGCKKYTDTQDSSSWCQDSTALMIGDVSKNYSVLDLDKGKYSMDKSFGKTDYMFMSNEYVNTSL